MMCLFAVPAITAIAIGVPTAANLVTVCNVDFVDVVSDGVLVMLVVFEVVITCTMLVFLG